MWVYLPALLCRGAPLVRVQPISERGNQGRSSSAPVLGERQVFSRELTVLEPFGNGGAEERSPCLVAGEHVLDLLVRQGNLLDGLALVLQRRIVVIDVRGQEEFRIPLKALAGRKIRDLFREVFVSSKSRGDRARSRKLLTSRGGPSSSPMLIVVDFDSEIAEPKGEHMSVNGTSTSYDVTRGRWGGWQPGASNRGPGDPTDDHCRARCRVGLTTHSAGSVGARAPSSVSGPSWRTWRAWSARKSKSKRTSSWGCGPWTASWTGRGCRWRTTWWLAVTGDGSEGSESVIADGVVVLVSFVREAWAHRTTGCQGEEGSSER